MSNQLASETDLHIESFHERDHHRGNIEEVNRLRLENSMYRPITFFLTRAIQTSNMRQATMLHDR